MSTEVSSAVAGTFKAGTFGHEVDDATGMHVVTVDGLADAAIGDCDPP